MSRTIRNRKGAPRYTYSHVARDGDSIIGKRHRQPLNRRRRHAVKAALREGHDPEAEVNDALWEAW